MKWRHTIWAVLWIAAPASAQTANPTEWSAYVDEAAERFALPRDWIDRVMFAESAGQTMLNDRPIRSAAGAMGLMQLMPATYEEMRLAEHLGSDPDDPHDNIIAGAGYLRRLFDRYGYPGLFAAYNAGPGRFEASLRGVALPGETREYVRKLTASSPNPPNKPGLFVPISGDKPRAIEATESALFVPLAASSRGAEGDDLPAGAE